MSKRYLYFSTRMVTNRRSHLVMQFCGSERNHVLKNQLNQSRKTHTMESTKSCRKITWQRKRKEKKKDCTSPVHKWKPQNSLEVAKYSPPGRSLSGHGFNMQWKTMYWNLGVQLGVLADGYLEVTGPWKLCFYEQASTLSPMNESTRVLLEEKIVHGAALDCQNKLSCYVMLWCRKKEP